MKHMLIGDWIALAILVALVVDVIIENKLYNLEQFKLGKQ